MKHIEYYFTGIDCPSCASKVETLLNKQDKISEARVNFLSKKIIITFEEKELSKEELEKIIRKLEPDVKLYDEEIEEDEEHEHNCCCHEHHHEHEHNCCCHEHHHEHEHNSCCHEHHHEHEHDSCCHEHHEHHHECCHEHHEHHHEHEHKCCSCKSNSKLFGYIKFILGLCFGVCALLVSIFLKNSELSYISRILYVVAYLLLANKIIVKSIKNMMKGNIFDENLLMLVASFGALIINEGLEALLVVLLYTIGEYFQDKALGSSTDAIASLTKLKVDITHLENGTDILTKKVHVGDVIIVKVGERIPLDGIIIKGDSSIDTKVITGESMPSTVSVNDVVLSGCINLTSVLHIKVTKKLSESTTSKIIEMVELASNKKSKTEEFITKFARIYTPIVLGLALVVFLVEWLLFSSFTVNDALNNCFVFLVSSCPCALVISIPLAFFGGIGRCSSFGVLVKGGNYVEALSKTKTICFDKTGTLTKGNFAIKNIVTTSINKEEFLNLLVSIESYSNHPIARSISKLEINQKLNINDVTELKGLGLKGNFENKIILVGNHELMENNNISIEKTSSVGTILYVAYDNQYLGFVEIVDEIKEDSFEMITNLRKLNVNTVMLTGDNSKIAEDVATSLKIDKVYSSLLPSDKLEILEEIINKKDKSSTVLYVGDGINDTPSLKLADVGVAIGGLGNDEAVLASDVVLLNNNMNNLVKAINVSKFTKKILLQNIVFALLVKFIALVIGTIGILGSYGMLLGVFADVGVCLITILNTLRILKHGGK